MNESINQTEQSGLSKGFARFTVLYDDSGLARDCVFAQVNPAFESLFSLREADVLGRTLSEVFEPMTQPQPNQMLTIAERAIRGESVEFEQYLVKQRRWVGVIAFSSEPSSIAAVFLIEQSKERPRSR